MKKDVSRREFAKNLAKVLIFGGLSHFSLSAFSKAGEHTGKDCPGGGSEFDVCKKQRVGNLFVETDYCPGGAPAEDFCDPKRLYRDNCPGEKIPEDECSISGAREVTVNGVGVSDDECNTGLPENDVCDNANAASDQCPSMKPDDDLCEPTQTPEFAKCYSGLKEDDACDPDGGKNTDDCPGGGEERDTCMPDRSGDECSPENDWVPLIDLGDSCKPKIEEDACGNWGAADVCYEGVNHVDKITENRGGQDICRGLVILGDLKPYGDGSDVCLDGSKEQDDCGGWNHNQGAEENDVCLPTASGEKDDLCDNTIMYDGTPVGSDDYCFGGLVSSDECKPQLKDEDECPGGKPEADECIPGASDLDECPGGGSTVDECNSGTRDEDECPGFGDEVDVCMSNVAESDECRSGVFGQDSCPQNDNLGGCTNQYPDYVE